MENNFGLTRTTARTIFDVSLNSGVFRRLRKGQKKLKISEVLSDGGPWVLMCNDNNKTAFGYTQGHTLTLYEVL